MANKVMYQLTAQELSQSYGVTNHGPFPESDRIGAWGFADSKCFQEISLTVPEGVELTRELVQKVVGTWVSMNLANQELVRATAKFVAYANPNKTSFYESLADQEPNAERFERTFKKVQETINAWKPLAAEGYSVTIIR